MLNDADGHGGGEADEAVNDAEALFRRLKRDVKADYNSKGQVNWRREAREDFDFEAGEQLNEEDKAILQDAKRPIVIFNRVGTTVDSVAGQEVGNRQEVQFLPRTPSAVANCFSSEKIRRQHLNQMADYAALICPTALIHAAHRHTHCSTASVPSGHAPTALAKIAGKRAEATMAIIDSQVHAYEANSPKRPWHSVPNWPEHVTGDEMVAAMDKVGVDGAIFISAFSLYRYDASYAVEVQRAHPGRLAIVKPLDPDDPDVADVVAEWKKTPGAVGIRIMLRKEEKRATDDPGLDRIARAAVRYDFPLNILCWDNLDAGTALIDRHPDTRFIIDHLGILQPRVPPAPPEPWVDLPKVLELAKRPNAVIKVSGACTLSREPYPYPDIWDPLARVFDAWGFDRCLWGTDWTRAFAVVNYEQAVEPFLKTSRLSDSERAMLMGGACVKAYGWSPKKG